MVIPTPRPLGSTTQGQLGRREQGVAVSQSERGTLVRELLAQIVDRTGIISVSAGNRPV